MSFILRRHLLLFFALLATTSFAADLEISTSDYLIDPDQEVQVDVTVNNADPLIIFSVVVQWDDSLVEFVDGFGVQTGGRVLSSEISTTSNLLTVTAFSILGDAVITAGTGTLFSFKLKGLQRGVSSIAFSNVTATAASGEVTDQLITDGSVDMGIGDVVVTPPGGAYLTAQTVALAAAGGETIYYTTDESAPTTSSAVYSAPITIDGPDGTSKRLRVLAVSASGRTSTADETYIFDSASPSATIDLANGQVDPTNTGTIIFAVDFSEDVNGFEQSDIVLSGSALANSAILSGGPQNFTVTVTGMSTAGTVVINFPAGAAEDAVTTAPSASPVLVDNSVLSDQVAPDSTITTTGIQGSENWPDLVSGTASDSSSGVASVEVAVQRFSDNMHWNGSAWGGSAVFVAAIGTSSWAFPLPANQLHDDVNYFIQSRATDAAGNVQSSNTTSTFTFDATVPSGSFFIGFANPSLTSDVNTSLFISVSDATQMRFKNDGGAFSTWLSYTGFTNWTLLNQDGTQTVTGEFRNTGGNVLSISDTIDVDLNPPTCTSVTVGPFGPSTWTGFVSGTAADAVSAINQVEIAVRRNADNLWFTGATWSNTQTFRVATGTDTWSVPLAESALTDSNSYRIFCRVSDITGQEELYINDGFTWDDSPPVGSFTINDGDPQYSTSATVDLHVSVTGATEMRFINDGGEFSAWVPVSSLLEDWVLKTRDGDRRVDGEFRDEAGNVLQVSDSITLDTAGPNGSFSINIGDPEFSNSVNTVLFMLVADAAQMRFRNAGDPSFSAFEPYSQFKNWTLNAVDGVLTVEAEFQDLAGNITLLSDSISLDTDPPVGSFTIGDGDPLYTSSPDISLFNAVTGATEMRFHNGNSSFGDWLDFESPLVWSLVDEDGVHSVTAQFRDPAKNTLTRNDTIILDRTAPSCSIATSGFYGSVNWSGEVVGTAADAASGVASVVITIQRRGDSMYFDGSDWGVPRVELPAVGLTNWTYPLAKEQLTDGITYDIECVATDNVGLSSATDSSEFSYDENPPACTFSLSGAYRSADWPAEVSGSVTDLVSGVASITISVRRTSDGFFYDGADFANGETLLAVVGQAPWTAALPLSALDDGDSYTVRCQVSDNAGNFADSATVTVSIDDSPPVGSFVIVAGDPPFVIDSDVTLVNSVTGAAEMRFANEADPFGDWTAFQPSFSWNLTHQDGSRSVRGEYRDVAGNVLAASDDVSLDLLAPDGSFGIGIGSPSHTNSKDLQLDIAVNGALEMRFRNDGEAFGEWMDFAATLDWALRDVDGTREVFGEFRDLADRVTALDDSIILDTDPPVGSFTVGDGDPPHSTARSVTLHHQVTGADEMRFRNGSDPFSEWQIYASTASWDLPDIDGLHTVTAEFRDFAHNTISDSDSITLDRAAPSCSISSSGFFSPALWTGQVFGNAADAASGVAAVTVTIQRQLDSLYFDGGAWGIPRVELAANGSTAWSYPLDEAFLNDGASYNLSCVATDNVGLSSGSDSAAFTFDASPPDCTFSVSGGYKAASWPGIIGGNVTDAVSGVDSLHISIQRESDSFYFNGATFASGEVLLLVAGQDPWVAGLSGGLLAEGDSYTLRCHVSDNAGNSANSAQTVFRIDDTAPSGNFVIGAGDPLFVTSAAVTLHNAVVDAVEMRFANDQDAFGAWEPYAATFDWDLVESDGTRIVRGEFRDDAGNVLAHADAAVLDLLPPSGGFTIGAADPEFSPLNVQLAIAVTGAIEMRFRNDGEAFSETWLTYGEVLSWALRDEDGTRTVFGEFRDLAGNVITPQDSTIVDRTPPECTVTTPAFVGPNTWLSQISGTAADAASGLAPVRIMVQRPTDNRYYNSLTWQVDPIELPVSGSSNWTFPFSVPLAHGDSYSVTCVATDLAGNTAQTPPTSTFTYDSDAPSGSISTNGEFRGDTWPNQISGSGSDALAGIGEVRVTVQRDGDSFYFTGSGWQVDEIAVSATGAESWNLPLVLGHLDDGESYTASAEILDAAGNSANSASQSFSLDTSAPSGTFTVGAGDPEVTAVTNVTLTNGISGAFEMRFANEGEAFSDWELFASTRNWDLPDPAARSDNGSFKVLAEFRDSVGNVGAFEDSITLDLIAPTGGFTIGATDPDFVLEVSVTLAIAVDGATKMRFANESDSFGAFVDYASELAWVIAAGEGLHTVRAEFQDAAGNTFASSDTTTLDTTAPIGSFVIDGAPGTSTREVDLLIGVVGANEMRFRNDGETFGEWVAFANTLDWTLRAEDGLRTVFGEFRDQAGRVVTRDSSITLDDTPPDGSFTIGNGNPNYRATLDVTLRSLVNDADEMRFANEDEAFGAWLPFNGQADWTLFDADGIRKVRAEFRDIAGNVLALEDTVELDRTDPSCTINVSGIVGADWADEVTGTVTDTGSGIGAATLVITRDSDGMHFNGVSWVAAAASFALSATWSVPLPLAQLADGETYTFTCQVTDLAGNTPAAESASVILDNQAPACAINTTGDHNRITWQGSVQGTASDAGTGLDTVTVTISRRSDGFFFDGAVWVDGQVDLAVAGGTWSVPLALEDLISDTYDLSCDAVDLAGNAAPTASSVFTMDSSGPNGTFTIGAGDPAKVNHTRVTLVSSVTGASEMRLRQQDGAFGGYIPFAATLHWDLEDEDGSHLVQIEYRDEAGNPLLLSDTVILDRTPPTGSFVIGPNDPAHTRLLVVGLINTTTDAVEMRFRNDDGIYGDFTTYQDSTAFTLSPGDGLREVFGEFKDDAGNIIEASDIITLDTIAPTGSFTIGVTNPTQVNTTALQLSMRVDDGVIDMRFSNDGGPFSSFETFVDTINYAIKDEDGLRTVTGEFRDIAGNVLTLHDTVLLDRVDPSCTITSTGVYRPESWPGAVMGTGDDDSSGIASVGIIVQRLSDLRYYTGDHWVGEETLVDLPTPASWSLALPNARLANGEYKVSCFPVDAAGNAAAPEVTTFYFDDAGPVCDSDMEGPYTALNWPGAITGTVSDPSGIASVTIRLQRSSGDFFHGSVWSSSAALLPTTGAGTWAYDVSAAQLPGEDTYTVHCVATDTADNVSDSVVATFILDTEPPVGSFTIGETDPAVTNQRGVLFRNAVTGATLMRFADQGGEFTAWQSYAVSRNWTLPDSDPGPSEFDNGERVVLAQFQDANGNVLALSDSITLDTVDPVGTFSINEGDPLYSTSNSVTLHFAVEGATEMRIRNGGSTFSSWLTYAATREWQLLGGDGSRGVEAQFRDGVDNTLTLSDSIIVDKVRPTGSFFIISSTTTYATEATVTLRSFVSGATEMRFKNDLEEFSEWESYKETTDWDLRDEDGTRRVDAEYRDVAGNILALLDTIFRDVTPPTCDVLTEGLLSTSSWPGAISGTANDNASGIDQITITFFRHLDNLWFNGTNWTSDKFNLSVSGSDSWSFPFSAPQLVASSYTVVCTIVDNAGNVAVDPVDFIWDTSPPTCEIIMENAYNITTWPGAIVGTATDIPSGVATVTITLQRSSDSLYWHDTEWAIDPFPLIANGSTDWSLPMNIGVLAVDATYTATCVATDIAGLSSQVDSVDFVVDGAAPQGQFTIGAGDPVYTTIKDVILQNNVDGAVQMRFADEGDALGEWEAYALTKNWTLPEDVARTSSPKLVQAEFKDVADNVLSLADSIIFDDEAPTGTFTIGQDNPAGTNSREVVIVLDVTGATEMRVGNRNEPFSDWVPLQASFAWQLKNEQGSRRVNVDVRDDAGNPYSMIDTIILDTVAPSGSFELNAGNPANTNARLVEIVIGIAGAHEMRFKNATDVEFEEWQSFSSSIFWELPDVEGVHTIQGEFRDEFGNLTAFNDSIILDQVVPECEVTTAGVFHNFEWLGNVQGTAGDATSGLGTVSVSIQRGKDGLYFDGINWQAAETSVLASTSGAWSVAAPTAKLLDDLYTVTCNVSDLAGNTSSCSDTFAIDDTPPTCTIATGLFSSLTWEGVKGTATDLESGIDTITVIVRRDQDGQFFTGIGWGSNVVLHDVPVAENWVLPLDVALLQDNVSYSVDCVVRDLATNLGPAESGSFSFDGTAPSGEFRVHDAEFVNSFDVILLNFVSGATQMRFQNDGEAFGEWLPYASSLEWTLRDEDGDRTVFADYQDEAGNPLNLQDSINVDTTPPGGTFSIGDGNPSETRVVDVQLHINITDGLEMRFRDLGGVFTNWEPIAATKDWTIADVEGIHTVEGEFRDVIGNVRQISDSIELDRLPPQGTFLIGAGDPLYSLSTAVTLDLDIDDGFEMRFANDAGPFGDWLPFATSASFDLADIDGVRTVRAEVRDSGGGVAAFSDTITLDSTPPACDTAVAGSYNGDTWPGLITGTLSDPASGVNSAFLSLQRVSDGMYWTGSTWVVSRTLISISNANWLLIIGPPALSSDHYSLSCFASDIAGNTRTGGAVQFTYDAQAPDCSIDTVGDLGISNWAEEVTGTASDALSAVTDVAVSIQRRSDNAYFDSNVWVAFPIDLTPTGIATWSVPLSGGQLVGGETYDIVCTATDALGNDRQRFSTFTIDNVPPSGTFVAGEGNPLAVSVRNIILQSDIVDAIDMRFSNDGLVFSEWTAYASEFAWNLPLDPGPVDIVAEYRDHVGNVLQLFDTITYDNQPPTGSFTIGNGDPAETNSGDVFLAINVVGASQMRFRNSDGSFGGFGPVITVFPWTLASGNNEQRTVHGEFRDIAGNTLALSDSIIIDNVGPSGSFSVGSGNPDFTKSILTTLISDVNEAVDMRFKNNDDPFGAFESYIPVRIWTLPNSGGTHTITGEYRDARGNVLSITDQITLDLDSPAANIQTTGSFGSATWPNEVAGLASDPSSGVDHVEVAVQRQSDGRYFDGLAWVTGQQLLAAVGETSWALGMDVSFLTDATSYSVIAIAHDKVGNSSAPVSRSFSFDSSAPPCTIDTTGVFGPGTWPGAISGSIDDSGENGLADVTVSVQRNNDGQFWTGTGWVPGLTRLITDGLATWSLTLPVNQLQNGVTYLISCHPEDNVGNVGNDQRQFVFDAEAPVFTFDPPSINIALGAQIDLLAGATAVDNVDDDVSVNISTSGTVNVNSIGDYSITYTVSDSAGNTGNAQRLFRVGLIVGGQVYYDGLQAGDTIVELTSAARETVRVTVPGGTGSFEFAVADGNYSIQAYMDVIPNQTIDASEPTDLSHGPIPIFGVAVTGIELRLSDWSHTFEFHHGWNLVSVVGPLVQPAIADAMPQILGPGVTFDGPSQAYFEVVDIAARQGTWLYAPEQHVVTVRGTYQADTSIPLAIGWNLIGVAHRADHPTFSNPGIRIVWTADRKLRTVESPAQLYPFNAYWINTSAASTIFTGP